MDLASDLPTPLFKLFLKEIMLESFVGKTVFSKEDWRRFLRSQNEEKDDEEEEEEEEEEVAELMSLAQAYKELMERGAYENWDIATTEQFLQTCDVSEAHSSCFLRFWRDNHSSILKHILTRSSLRPSFTSMSWRVDQHVMSRHQSQEVSEDEGEALSSSAIFEILTKAPQVSNGKSSSSSQSVLRFEVNEQELTTLLDTFDQIEASFASMTT